MRGTKLTLLGITILLLLVAPGSPAEGTAGVETGGPVPQSTVQAQETRAGMEQGPPASVVLSEPELSQDLAPPILQSEAVGSTWHIKLVDAPKYFDELGSRSLALDADERPHIAYGADRLYYARYDGAQWHLETVDSAEGVGKYTSLALDLSGLPHISYCRIAATHTPHLRCDALEYAHYDGTMWITQTVDMAGVAYLGESSLALDSSDRPHIIYRTANNTLRYAYYNASAWITETVGSTALTGDESSVSIAVDTLGQPHISYFGVHYSDEGLMYAHRDGLGWHIELVDTDGFYYTSLSLDGSGHPHISYQSATDGSLKYAYYNGGWWTTTACAEPLSGYYTSMTLDSMGRPHIAHVVYPSFDLRYTYHDGTTWNSETVAAALGQWGGRNSLALDSADRPHIAYLDKSNYVLRYVYDEGAYWQAAVVDHEEDVGRYSSLALDTSRLPHISYCKYNRGEFACDALNYASYDGTTWITETVDDSASAGRYSSLALDSASRPHIAYGDDPIGLTYAYYTGTSWDIQKLDKGGWAPSLALDSSDQPLISYMGSNRFLKYAHFDGSAWYSSTVDNTGEVGWSTALALDSLGRPRIVYYDTTNGILKYALNDGTGWQIVEVATGGNIDAISLALDSADQPHISYSGANLVYVYYTGSMWKSKVVDSSGGNQISLQLDTSDRPHVAYYDSAHAGDPALDGLKYAYHDGLSWHIEMVDGGQGQGSYASMALDSAGRVHISYYDSVGRDLRYAVRCVPVAGVSVEGPTSLPAGITAVYTATYTPPTATVPIIAWDNGTFGPTAVYSWSLTGTRTLAVTATNDGGQVRVSLTITVFCQPVGGAQIEGPLSLVVREAALYHAAVLPITASLPITFAWDNGIIGPTAAYSFTEPGVYTLTVTAVNKCGEAIGTVIVEVNPYRVYLPLVFRRG